MELYAVSDELVLGIVSAALSFLTACVTGVVAVLIALLNRKQDAAALKVEAVEKTLKTSTENQTERAFRHDTKLDGIAGKVSKLDGLPEQVEEVRKNTNGLVAHLMQTADEKGFQRGGDEARAAEGHKP